MAMTLTSPVTGGAQTGFTAPTYTLVSDIAPSINGKQWAVSALGGTQAGVIAHSGSAPFTVTVTRGASFKLLGKPNPITGLVKDVPVNTYKVIVRKGCTPLVGQPYSIELISATVNVPAGADTYDASNLRAGISLFVGSLNQLSAGLGDTVASGLL
jgi:hypothetical protein